MMDKSFGLILAVIALIAGVMLLTGHGDILLKGGNAKLRKEKYDEKKMTWGSGVALLLIGVATLIAVSYTHLTLPTTLSQCRSRWSPYH